MRNDYIFFTFSGLRYADGVLPGQGSPDYEPSMPPVPNALGGSQKQQANKTTSAATAGGVVKKRIKRIKIKVVQIRSRAEAEADKHRGPPPPPPPGDPPLMTASEFRDKYAYKGTLPKHVLEQLVSA